MLQDRPTILADFFKMFQEENLLAKTAAVTRVLYPPAGIFLEPFVGFITRMLAGKPGKWCMRRESGRARSDESRVFIRASFQMTAKRPPRRSKAP
jgi:hypothetical protein